MDCIRGSLAGPAGRRGLRELVAEAFFSTWDWTLVWYRNLSRASLSVPRTTRRLASPETLDSGTGKPRLVRITPECKCRNLHHPPCVDRSRGDVGLMDRVLVRRELGESRKASRVVGGAGARASFVLNPSLVVSQSLVRRRVSAGSRPSRRREAAALWLA
jgi:hypothetical protein